MHCTSWGNYRAGDRKTEYGGLRGIPGLKIETRGTRQPSLDAKPLEVNLQSASVAEGMRLRKVQPEYPLVARNAEVSGTVVLQARINKNGGIENLNVVSGPSMLQQAALDAVKQWRYRPYLIDGEPVEVLTTVNVVFDLSSSPGQMPVLPIKP